MIVPKSGMNMNMKMKIKRILDTWGRGQTPIRDCDVSGQESDSGSDPCNKKPSSRSRRVFERANGLGVLAGAAENREAGQAQAYQQGAGGFGNDLKIIGVEVSLAFTAPKVTRINFESVKGTIDKAGCIGVGSPNDGDLQLRGRYLGRGKIPLRASAVSPVKKRTTSIVRIRGDIKIKQIGPVV